MRLVTLGSAGAGTRAVLIDESRGFILVGIEAGSGQLYKCRIFANGTRASVTSKYFFSSLQKLVAGIIDTQNGYSYWYVHVWTATTAKEKAIILSLVAILMARTGLITLTLAK